jgi:hypothetical protein
LIDLLVDISELRFTVTGSRMVVEGLELLANPVCGLLGEEVGEPQ